MGLFLRVFQFQVQMSTTAKPAANKAKPTTSAKRIQKELAEIALDPPPNVCAANQRSQPAQKVIIYTNGCRLLPVQLTRHTRGCVVLIQVSRS
jgi:hypothetical protein